MLCNGYKFDFVLPKWYSYNRILLKRGMVAMENITCGFIGLGLIGGSIAKALRAAYPNMRIIAYDRDKATLKLAEADDVINDSFPHIGSQFGTCDIIFLCAPVSNNDENLLELKQYLSPDALLTDVGSVKTDIHEHIKAAGLEGQFIGGHPMAGSERTGYLNSKALLLENAYYILTPTESVSPEKVELYRKLVLGMNAIPLILSCDQHDYITAAVSHVPHVVSASLVNLVKNSDSKEHLMRMIAAGGFKDITRISSSSAVMWQQICLTNRDNIVKLLDDYIAELEKIREEVSEGNEQEIYDFFDSARVYRDTFSNSPSGPIKKNFSLKVDIPDQAGAIAKIVDLLSEHNLSIKNIGISHNREYEEGLMFLEFYEEISHDAAFEVLTSHGYNVH